MRTLTLVLALTLGCVGAVHAQAQASALSHLSALPVAVSVTAPVGMLVAGSVLTVAAVETAADATVWVLERASDGARASVRLSGQMAGVASVTAGTVITASAFSAGVVLSAAGKVVAYLPNEIGKALLHNERVTR